MKKIFLLLFISFYPLIFFCVTATWGGADGDWDGGFLTFNWVPIGAKPLNPGDIAIFPNAAASQVTLDVSPSVGKIEFEQFSTYTFIPGGNVVNIDGAPAQIVFHQDTSIFFPFNIIADTELIFEGSNFLAIDGTFTGSGSLTFKTTSNGAVLIEGFSNFLGTLIIDSSILSPDSPNAMPNSPLSMVGVLGDKAYLKLFSDQEVSSLTGNSYSEIEFFGDSSLTIGSDNSSTVFSGVFSDLGGQGDLFKKGTGTLTLSSINNNVTSTIINGGTLAINGDLSSDVTVNASGTLAGAGTIYGDCEIIGSIKPGNSIDTLSIVGDVTFNGGTYEVELNPTSADLLDVTGSVTINSGSVEVIPDFGSGSYQPNTKYTIIQASDGITGRFDDVICAFPAFIGEVSYDIENIVELWVNLVPFSEIISQGNAGRVAQYIDNIGPFQEGTDLDNVIESLLFLSASEMEDALDQMHPAILKGFALVQHNNSNNIMNAIHTRCDILYSTKCLRAIDNKRSNLWTSVNGSKYYQRNYSYLSGFDASVISGLIGYDYGFESNLFLGLFLGYDRSDIDWYNDRGKGDIDSIYYGGYLNWNNDFYFVEGAFVRNYSKYHGRRNIDFSDIHRKARSSFWGDEILIHINNGFIINSGNSFEVKPFFSFDYDYIAQENFSEKNAESLNLHVKKNRYNFFRTEVGLDFAKCCYFSEGKLIPKLGVSWINEMRVRSNKKYEVSFRDYYTNTFDVYGMSPHRHFFGYDIGMDFNIAEERANFSLLYSGEIAKNVDRHFLNVYFSWHF